MPGISAGIPSPSLRGGNLHPSGASSKHLAPQLNNRPPRFGISILTLAVDSYTPALSRLDSAGVYVSSPRIARAGCDLMRL